MEEINVITSILYTGGKSKVDVVKELEKHVEKYYLPNVVVQIDSDGFDSLDKDVKEIIEKTFSEEELEQVKEATEFDTLADIMFKLVPKYKILNVPECEGVYDFSTTSLLTHYYDAFKEFFPDFTREMYLEFLQVSEEDKEYAKSLIYYELDGGFYQTQKYIEENYKSKYSLEEADFILYSIKTGERKGIYVDVMMTDLQTFEYLQEIPREKLDEDEMMEMVLKCSSEEEKRKVIDENLGPVTGAYLKHLLFNDPFNKEIYEKMLDNLETTYEKFIEGI